MNPFGARHKPSSLDPPTIPELDRLICDFYDSTNHQNSVKGSNETCGESLSSGKAHCYGLWTLIPPSQPGNSKEARFRVQKKGCWINDADCGAVPSCYPILRGRNTRSGHVFCCCHGNLCNEGDDLPTKYYKHVTIGGGIESSSSTPLLNNITLAPPPVPNYSSPRDHGAGGNFFSTLLTAAMSTRSSRSLLIAAMTAVPLCIIVLLLFALFFAYNYRSRIRNRNRNRNRTKSNFCAPMNGSAKVMDNHDINRSLMYDSVNKLTPRPEYAADPASYYFGAQSDQSRSLSLRYGQSNGGDSDRLLLADGRRALSQKLTSPPAPKKARTILESIFRFARFDSGGGARPLSSIFSASSSASPQPHSPGSQRLGSHRKSNTSRKKDRFDQREDPMAKFHLIRLISHSPISKVYFGERICGGGTFFDDVSYHFRGGGERREQRNTSSAALAIKIYPADQVDCWRREVQVCRTLTDTDYNVNGNGDSGNAIELTTFDFSQRKRSNNSHPNILELLYASAHSHPIYDRDTDPDNSCDGNPSSPGVVGPGDLLVIVTPPATLCRTVKGSVRSNGICRGPETTTDYWVVTAFQENGSLLDYLKLNTISWDRLVSIALDVSSALAYIHSSSLGGAIPKPAIVHKDLKSRNVFLDHQLRAKIGDFGAALILTSVTKISQSQGQRGTLRYMAPEILEGAISFSQECFLKIDVYALSLIFWELLSRCHDINTNITQYKAPYEEELSSNPTPDEVQNVVCGRNIRPKILESWMRNKLSAELVSTVRDCWERDPEARISAMTIHERIKELAEETKLMTPPT